MDPGGEVWGVQADLVPAGESLGEKADWFCFVSYGQVGEGASFRDCWAYWGGVAGLLVEVAWFCELHLDACVWADDVCFVFLFVFVDCVVLDLFNVLWIFPLEYQVVAFAVEADEPLGVFEVFLF